MGVTASGHSDYLLRPRSGETDDEARFREAINRHAEKLLSTLDSAMAVRTAPPNAQRQRARARNAMLDLLLISRDAFERAQQAKTN